MDLYRGCSHWFLNQNLNNLIVPHIVPRGNANNMSFIKFEKSAKSTHPIVQYTLHSLASDCCCDTKVFFNRWYIAKLACNMRQNSMFRRVYASLFKTAFLSLKGQFHEIFILIALLTIFLWVYNEHAKTAVLTIKLLPIICNLQKCYHPVSFICPIAHHQCRNTK